MVVEWVRRKWVSGKEGERRAENACQGSGLGTWCPGVLSHRKVGNAHYSPRLLSACGVSAELHHKPHLISAVNAMAFCKNPRGLT